MRFLRFLPLALLLLIVLFVFTAGAGPHRALSVTFFDVGQGDSVFIESPTGVQVLVDGGPDRAALRALGTRLPFYDRSLDYVIATHPDQDHIGGLVDVLSRYDVGTFIESGVVSETPASQALAQALRVHATHRVVVARPQVVPLGGGAYLRILFPDRDVSGVESNTGSVVAQVVYGASEFLLTGDSPKGIEKYLVSAYGASLESDVLKAGHHGSDTSSSEVFARAVNPRYVVYSRGCNNRYGHPAPETLALFNMLNVPALDTCTDGTVRFVSNGMILRLSH